MAGFDSEARSRRHDDVPEVGGLAAQEDDRPALESGLLNDLIRRDIDLDVAADMIPGAAVCGTLRAPGYASKVPEIVLLGALQPGVVSEVPIDFER